jgi:hypothetical protein
MYCESKRVCRRVASGFALLAVLAGLCGPARCVKAEPGTGNTAPAASAPGHPDFAALVDDRIAVEKVYYRHRLQTTQPFEEVLPRSAAEQLVRRDLEAEQVLEKKLSVRITAADLADEIKRINASTRAPDVLDELKQALDNDPVRFGRTVVKPILIDRWMRERARNGSAASASERTRMEILLARLSIVRREQGALREMLELARQSGVVTDVSWRLDAAPNPPAAARGGKYSNEATAEVVPAADPGVPAFGELRPELQQLIRGQLRQPGDLSPVIETDDRLFLFILCERHDAVLRVASVSIVKAAPVGAVADGKAGSSR